MYRPEHDISRLMAQQINDNLVRAARRSDPRQLVLMTSTVGILAALGYTMPPDIPEEAPVEIVYTYPGEEEELRAQPWSPMDDMVRKEETAWLVGHGLGKPIGLFNGRDPRDRVNVVRRYSNAFERLAEALKDVKFESKSPVHDWSGEPIKPRTPRRVPTWKRATKGRHCRPW